MRQFVTVMVCVVVLGMGGPAGAGEAAESSAPVTLVAMSEQGITLGLQPPPGKGGRFEARLLSVDGQSLGQVSTKHRGKPFQATLGAQLDPAKPEEYILRYRFDAKAEFKQHSLFFLNPGLETVLLTQREFLAGTRPVFRVLVRDRGTGQPMEGAEVSAVLSAGEEELARHTSRTSHRGEASLPLALPERDLQAALRIDVTTGTGKDTIEETLRIRKGLQTLLTTDKPMYQPGQTMHLRALSLTQPDRTPLKNTEVTFEVEDSKGNKVFKHRMTTDAFGISHADFVLADELNEGTYRIRHLAGAAQEEKTVNVERYVLPKFKVEFTPDRAFYSPGDVVKGDLQVDYFFGKPVAGAAVSISAAKFDVEYADFQSVEGTTDANGRFAFEVTLPDHFVGQPLEAGKASAKFDVSVIDTADHREHITRNVSVTRDPILIAAVPEGGDLVPGLENRVYVVTTYADGTPAQCSATWSNPPDGPPVAFQTDDGGFGEILITPRDASTPTLELSAKDTRGNEGLAAVRLDLRETEGDDHVLLRTNRALYKTGDTLGLTVFSTRRKGAVYVDIIRNRQTVLTQTVDLDHGIGTATVGLTGDLAGTVQVNAYIIGKNGVITRDRRIVLVDPANDLALEIASDEETYLPAGNAKLSVRVTDGRGTGVAAALGVVVVDEAVFALQEMQPGLEKVYFYLEKEIATPRYEIHGFELDGIMPVRGKEPRVDHRGQAARVVLAAAEEVDEYPVHVNTYERDNKAAAFEARMQQLMAASYRTVNKALSAYCKKLNKDLEALPEGGINLDDLIHAGVLRRNQALDPWGHPMRLSGQRCTSCERHHDVVLSSAGIDGEWDTADDTAYSRQLDLRVRRRGLFGGRGGFVDDMMVMEAMPMAANAQLGVAVDFEMEEMAFGAPSEAAGAAPPRIRKYFPETLYFNPAVITGGDGLASLDIPLADSITTWRMTCMASSSEGALGSATSGIRVFQDFFVDIDFPVSLTQNDRVSVPVAVYNYLDDDQSIRLVAEPGDGFEMSGRAEETVNLAPSEVSVVYFPVVAKGVGVHEFTVFGYGAEKSDAVSRTVEIVPDGKEELVTFSGRLEGDVQHTVTIPEQAIPDASKVFVKVYPGVLSQIVEGLDQMLRMPFGCFEQTSSVTYPNILVLDYMKTTGRVSPELQMKAEGFINAGYQRLVSFEVDGGGFEWFGKAPAHRILTAYGLMEFHDMSKVHDVDPSIISRTQRWLAGAQAEDGSYLPSEGGIREGAINRYTDDVLRNTAYITWALAHTGYTGPETAKGVVYLREHLGDLDDNFTIALTANALVTADRKDATTLDVLRKLLERKTEEDDVVYWKNESETPTHGRGNAANIEVTGLAVQAFVQAGREPGTVSKAVTYLARGKDALGTWHSTQATIQALRAMLMAERGATQSVEASIRLIMNGNEVRSLTIDESNSDVLQLIDLKEQTRVGENRVGLTFAGEGSLQYQVVGRYYLPRIGDGALPASEALSIRMNYDRTWLSTDDIMKVDATVTCKRPGRAKMIIVDLGLPPGFTLIPDRLNALVTSGVIQKYKVTGRQIIVYLDELVQDEPVTISYDLLAKYPLRAKTAKSVVYEYYDPDARAEAAPVEIVVEGR